MTNLDKFVELWNISDFITKPQKTTTYQEYWNSAKMRTCIRVTVQFFPPNMPPKNDFFGFELRSAFTLSSATNHSFRLVTWLYQRSSNVK